MIADAYRYWSFMSLLRQVKRPPTHVIALLLLTQIDAMPLIKLLPLSLSLWMNYYLNPLPTAKRTLKNYAHLSQIDNTSKRMHCSLDFDNIFQPLYRHSFLLLRAVNHWASASIHMHSFSCCAQFIWFIRFRIRSSNYAQCCKTYCIYLYYL